MTQKRRRMLKPIDRNLPPFEPLALRDVQLIAKEGGLECADDSDFFNALEFLRLEYRAQYRWREVTITDLQLRAEIHDALQQIARLKEFFLNPSINVASVLLFLREQEQSGAVPSLEHPDRLITLAKQREALGYLEGWVRLLNDKCEGQAAIKPDWFVPSSAAKLGLNELVIGLADLWQSWSGETEPAVGRQSRWIPFLRQSVKTVTQLDIGGPAARKLMDRAVKHLTSPQYKIPSVHLEN